MPTSATPPSVEGAARTDRSPSGRSRSSHGPARGATEGDSEAATSLQSSEVAARNAPTLKVRENEAPWTADELAAVQEELETELRRLLAEIEESDAQIAQLMRDSTDAAGDDQADTGAKAFEREQEMTLAHNTRELVLQNQRALVRIGKGTYGTCESCGNAIGKRRLQAFPRATLCVACKQQQERH